MLHSLLLAGVTTLTISLSGPSTLAQPSSKPTKPASVTVFPVVITPSDKIPDSLPTRVAEVVGLFLERAGMAGVEVGTPTFMPPGAAGAPEVATAFANFVKEHPTKTECAIFAQLIGTPKTGPQEIRTVVVREGKVLLASRADTTDFAHAKVKPKCPMTCALFVANELRDFWQLDDPQRSNAPKGKMAALMDRRSGLPPQAELDAIKGRLAELQSKLQTSKVAVYSAPRRTGTHAQTSARLAVLLNEQGICQAEVAATSPKLNVKGDPNEQKVLWDTARAFRRFLRSQSPAADYALLVDYGIGKSQVGYVHLILCDRNGDWVLVDFQNSHHADFQHVQPKGADDCNRLAVRRLQHRLAK